jgi:hypothetical protein
MCGWSTVMQVRARSFGTEAPQDDSGWGGLFKLKECTYEEEGPQKATAISTRLQRNC